MSQIPSARFINPELLSLIDEELRRDHEPQDLLERFTYNFLASPTRSILLHEITYIALAVLSVLCTVGLGIILIIRVEQLRSRFKEHLSTLLSPLKLLEKEINTAIDQVRQGKSLETFLGVISKIMQLAVQRPIDYAILAARSLPAIAFTKENIQIKHLPTLSRKKLTDLRQNVLYSVSLEIIKGVGMKEAPEVFSYLFEGDAYYYRLVTTLLVCDRETETKDLIERIVDPDTRKCLHVICEKAQGKVVDFMSIKDEEMRAWALDY